MTFVYRCIYHKIDITLVMLYMYKAHDKIKAKIVINIIYFGDIKFHNHKFGIMK